MKTLCCIMPTIGRTTLPESMISVLSQLGHDDELIVVGDGPTPDAIRMFPIISNKFPNANCRYMESELRAHDRGATPRDVGIGASTSDYLLWIDDDDLSLPNAVKNIRKHLTDVPTLHIFGWRGNPYFNGFMSGQQMVVPREGSPRWGDFKTDTHNDKDFYNNAIKIWPTEQHDIMIADSPNHPGGGRWF